MQKTTPEIEEKQSAIPAVQEKQTKVNPLGWFGLGMLVTVLVGSGIYYFTLNNKISLDSLPSPVIQPTPVLDKVSSLKTYSNENYSFKYPADWQVMPKVVTDLRSEVEFKSKSKVSVLRVAEISDYDTSTGKPISPDTLIRTRDVRVTNVTIHDAVVDGHQAKRLYDPGEEGHTPPYEQVLILVPEKKLFIELYFKSVDSSLSFADNVRKFFDPLISTFRLTLVTSSLSISSQTNIDSRDWHVYSSLSKGFSIRYPVNWVVTESIIDGTPTLVLTKNKITDHPKVISVAYVGTPYVLSTSGAICANESFCDKVGSFSVIINGKSYVTDLFHAGSRTIYNDPTTTLDEYYVFQVHLTDVASSPTLTSRFEDRVDGQMIADVISTISYNN